MGYSATVIVTNKSTDLIRVIYEGGNCMDGTGSWDGSFITPNSSYPAQTIEASQAFFNGCFDKASNAAYKLVKLDMKTGKYVKLTSFVLTESDNSWAVTSNEGDCHIKISNASDGATIGVIFNPLQVQ